MTSEDNKMHQLFKFGKEIEERGLMLFDDVHSMPVYGEPLLTSYMIVAVNISGEVRADCDMQPVCFQPHDFSVLLPRHMLCAYESSLDYHAILIVIAPWVQKELKVRYPDIFRDNFFYIYRHDLHLTDLQYVNVIQIFRAIQAISLISTSNRLRMLGDLLDVLFLYVQDCRHQNGIADYKPTLHEKICADFYIAITEHYRESHEVKFYADLFNLSPKHFSEIIKKQSNINALEWINKYVCIQAQRLLRYHVNLSVNDISESLGFSDAASFSRFFKQKTGLSPTEYRDKV